MRREKGCAFPGPRILSWSIPAARLAAILPAPLKRKPNRMDYYSAIIEERMRAMGW
jgi:hypothetical protein